MNPIDLHQRIVVLLRELPTRRRGGFLARGVAWHDGQQVELRSEADAAVICVLPEDLVAAAMPVTGVFRDWWPDAHVYIVCGDRALPGLQARSDEA